MIGRRVGRYRVLAALGKGGMSTVWRAHDEMLGRDVALKVLSSELADSEESRRRFRHEAEVASRLDHPGIVAVYDHGEADGAIYITMALIEGETVAERLVRSLLPIDEALNIAIAAAEALGYAHSRIVTHRDVTSRNVMLARDGRVLVLDFGLALAAGISRVSSSTTTVGTIAYMSPEVLLGREAGPRSDLYGLGVVIYEMLTGRTPFQGERREVIEFAALHQPIAPPSTLRAEITSELDGIVLRLMARQASERYPDTATLIADLRSMKRSPTAEAGPRVPQSNPPAGPPGVRPVAADLLANRSGPIYLFVPQVEVHSKGATHAHDTRVAADLTDALAATFTSLGRVHVVSANAPALPGESSAEHAARSGAQMALVGSLRIAGAQARVGWKLLDASNGSQIAAGAVRGVVSDPFRLEDELIADVRRELRLEPASSSRPGRLAARPLAASERRALALRYLTRPDHEASVDGAMATLEKLVEGAPEDAVLLAALGRAYLAKHVLTREHAWLARAADIVNRAQRACPDAADTLVAIGELHLDGGRFAEALEDFTRASRLRAESIEARIGMAWAMCRLERGTEAESLCREILSEWPDDWRGYHTLAKILMSRGSYALAVEPCGQALRLSPDNAWVSNNLGTALFRDGRVAEALAAYRRSVEIHPTALALSNLGTALFYEQRFAEAATAFESATEFTSADPLLWGNLGNARRYSRGFEALAPEALELAVGLMREHLNLARTDADG